jgi:hypothetical protein
MPVLGFYVDAYAAWQVAAIDIFSGGHKRYPPR